MRNWEFSVHFEIRCIFFSKLVKIGADVQPKKFGLGKSLYLHNLVASKTVNPNTQSFAWLLPRKMDGAEKNICFNSGNVSIFLGSVGRQIFFFFFLIEKLFSDVPKKNKSGLNKVGLVGFPEMRHFFWPEGI